jgi:hypothetical protein
VQLTGYKNPGIDYKTNDRPINHQESAKLIFSRFPVAAIAVVKRVQPDRPH